MAFQRIHIDGTLGSGSEEWSTSFAVQAATAEAVTDSSELSGWAEDALGLFLPGTGWSGALRSMIGISAAVRKIRIYNYPSPGAHADAVGESSGTGTLGSGAATVPFQSALVYTLQTTRPGRSFRGRMYWPFLTADIEETGKINTSSITLGARATDFKNMLNALCGAGPLLNIRPMVVSAVQGAVTPVTSVRVGDIVDTQRRRRDGLVESFATAAV